MPVTIISEATDDGIAVDPNGFQPIPGSKALRTIDVTDLCKKAAKKTPTPQNPHDCGDLVCITYGEVSAKGKSQRCFRIIFFLDGTGEKGVYKYPDAATIWALKKFFERRLANVLGCDADEMATAIAEYNPWQ